MDTQHKPEYKTYDPKKELDINVSLHLQTEYKYYSEQEVNVVVKEGTSSMIR